METLKVKKTIHSETITIKGLRPFIGQDVDIIVIPRAKKTRKAPSEKKNNAAGLLSEFSNPRLYENESEIWNIVVNEKHRNS